MKVVKFGGSSVADAGQFQKVKAIIDQDVNRQIVVISAAGKYGNATRKLTDTLYLIADGMEAGRDVEPLFNQVLARLEAINIALQLNVPLIKLLHTIRHHLAIRYSRDYLVSRGEFLTAHLMAAYLGYTFVDAANLLFFNKAGAIDEAKTQTAYQQLASHHGIVVPGFYGRDADGHVKLMPRGGSDISGAWLARLAHADLYENWTDVSGIKMADPRIIKDADSIDVMSYDELRELTYMGFSVFQEEAVQPVRECGIPTRILNTNAPEDPGTLIIHDDDPANDLKTITGIAGRKHYLVITVRKYQLALHLEVIQHALGVVAAHHLVVDYLPTGIDSFSLLIREPRRQVSVQELTAEIAAACQPDKMEVTENVALIAMVSRKLRQRPAIAGKILAYLDDNLLNVQLVSQTNDDINLLIGVHDLDYDKAVRVIYSSIHQNFQRPAPYIEGIA